MIRRKRIWFAALGIVFAQALSAVSPQTVAEAVLDRLYAANGNYQFKKPKLIISAENKKVAAYSPWKNAIVLDEKAYKICQSLGRDSLAALAYMLGHELVHAYQSQIKGQHLKTNFLAYDQGYQSDIRTEKVADIQGLFNAYLAGYGVLKTMPAVIERVYRAYDLMGKNLAGYPPLEERKASGREVVAIAQNLCDLFEAANYLLAIGQAGLACAAFEHILQYYQGREIYNNLGVAYTLSAQQFWNPQLDRFIYPVEADWFTKLTHIAAARGQEQADPSAEPLRLAFLEKAIAHLEAAARLDAGYLPARINILCALNMKGDPVAALRYAELNLMKFTRGKKKSAGQETEMVEIALGITYALQPDGIRKSDALRIFQRLSDSPNALVALYARQNEQSLNAKANTAAAPPEIPLPESLRRMAAQMQFERATGAQQTVLDEKTGLRFAQQQGISAATIVFSNGSGNLVSLLRLQNKLAPDAALDIPDADLSPAAYRNVLPTREGALIKSPRDKLLLRVDARGRVLEMIKYMEH